MGCDIHGFVEVRDAPGIDNWHLGEDSVIFDWRSYSMFGFLANVRNYSHCPTVTGEEDLRGLPTDSAYLQTPGRYRSTLASDLSSDGDYHSFHWVRLDELLNYDYDALFEDLRYTGPVKGMNGQTYMSGAAVATPGDGNGTWRTMRDSLGPDFFMALEKLKELGSPEDVRIVMWFDN